jgi:GH18 family chitinase
MKFLLFIFLFTSLLSSNSTKSLQQNADFRIVGYYSLQAAMKKDALEIPFGKLTHINLYFLNPDVKGNFKQNLHAVMPFINAAHAHNVKVLLSIGGGGVHPHYANLLKDRNRVTLVHNLVSLVLKYDFDGIDVDIEGNDIDENYDNFSIELSTALHKRNKLITAAIAVYFKEDYTNKALDQYDFLNLMSYDHTAAWEPKKTGPHATYQQAVDDLSYFRGERNIPKEKITLGVPFYGYGFGPKYLSRGLTIDYDDIVTKYSGAEWKDEYDVNDGTIIYYNGLSTIKMKTLLAKQEASGIMIWQLSGDAAGPKSLLNEIDEASKESK